MAVFTTSALQAGVRIITASYSGDVNLLPSVSPQLQQTVKAMCPVDIKIVSDVNPSQPGQMVTFNVTISSIGACPVPTGNITLSETLGNSGQVVYYGDQDLKNGQAVFQVSTLSSGNHPLAITYPGDPFHYPKTSDTYQQRSRPLLRSDKAFR